MRRDPTEFRQRFLAYKEGKMPYENGLPKYAEGTPSYDSTMEFLKKYEGFKDTTYLDGNGIPTIGYGFTDSSLVDKGTISRTEADRRLKQEVASREKFLSKMKNWDSLSEGSKTALRSYYYNYPAGFKPTTKFMKAWNAGDYEEAIRQVDAGMNDKKNPGLRKRRLEELALLKADPFLRPILTIQPTPIVNQPVSTAVRQVIPAELTIPAYDTTISPYISGKPMLKLQPRVKLPDLVEMMEDSEWLTKMGFKHGKLPRFGDGLSPSEQKAYNNAYNWMSSYYRSPGYMQRFKKLGNISKQYFNSEYNFFDNYNPGEALYRAKTRTDSFVVGKPRNDQDTYTNYRVDYITPLQTRGVVLGKDKRKLALLYGGIDNIIAHELGHALDNHIYIQNTDPSSLGYQTNSNLVFLSDIYPIFRDSKSYNDYMDSLDTTDAILVGKTPIRLMDGSTKSGHDGKPAESYADLLMLRYQLNKAGIFDARTTDKFTLDHLNKFKKNTSNKNRLFENFSDDDIIWMMNNVAQADNKKEDGLFMACAGKLPTFKNGKSSIHINPANKGKFNATKKRTGKTTEELAHSKNPLTRKRAIFALNARKWHH